MSLFVEMDDGLRKLHEPAPPTHTEHAPDVVDQLVHCTEHDESEHTFMMSGCAAEATHSSASSATRVVICECVYVGRWKVRKARAGVGAGAESEAVMQQISAEISSRKAEREAHVVKTHVDRRGGVVGGAAWG